MSPAAQLYVVATVVLGLVVVGVGLWLHPLGANTTVRVGDLAFTQATVPVLLFLAVLTQIAALAPIRSQRAWQVIFDPFLIATGLFAPGGGVGLVAWLATFDGRLPGKRIRLWVIAFNRAAIATSDVVGSLIVSILPRDEWWGLPLQTLLYAVISIAISVTVVAGEISLTRGTPFGSALRWMLRPSTLIWTLTLPLSGGVVFLLMLTLVGKLMIPVVFLLILGVRGSIEAARDSAELREKTVELAAQALDARDRWTESHSIRVGELASRLGHQLGLGARESELLRTAGSLHDLGKIGIRDDILSKRGRLSDEEWEIMRRHPDIGADMIAQHPALKGVAAIVRHHHERMDGTGYPAGLKGDVIPLGARIVAVAESFDYITTLGWPVRPHPLTVDEALIDISSHSGSWYEPRVVNALRALIDSEGATSSATADLGPDRPATVLVVDDDDIAKRLCQRVLEKAGYRVLTASDALGGVSLASAYSPDVIVLDDAMPGMSSLEAILLIKKQRPSIAIVVTTVDPSAWNRERYLWAGAADVLNKPFRLVDLTAGVAKLTANRVRK